jgi:hypothetical protein
MCMRFSVGFELFLRWVRAGARCLSYNFTSYLLGRSSNSASYAFRLV